MEKTITQLEEELALALDGRWCARTQEAKRVMHAWVQKVRADLSVAKEHEARQRQTGTLQEAPQQKDTTMEKPTADIRAAIERLETTIKLTTKSDVRHAAELRREQLVSEVAFREALEAKRQ